MFIIREYSKKYKRQEILNIKSYQFNNSGLYCIVGPNGSGKTTFIKSLVGLVKYDGDIYFNNTNIKDLKNDIFKEVCYISQFNSMLLKLTLIDNLNINELFLDEKNKVNTTLENKKICSLSGGWQKRYNFERFLNFDYKCLILDEPTVSLDNKNRKFLFDYIKKVSESKLVIVVTHDEELIELSDKVIDINKINNSNVTLEEVSVNKNIQEINKIPFKYRLNIIKEDFFGHFLKLIFSIFFLASLLFVIVGSGYDSDLYKNDICNQILPYIEVDSYGYSVEKTYLTNGKLHNMFMYKNYGINILDNESYEKKDIEFFTYFSYDTDSIIISDLLAERLNIEFEDSYTILFEMDLGIEPESSINLFATDKYTVESTNYNKTKEFFNDREENDKYEDIISFFSYVIMPADFIFDFFSKTYDNLPQPKYVVSNTSEFLEYEKIDYGIYYSLFYYIIRENSFNVYRIFGIVLTIIFFLFIIYFILYISTKSKNFYHLIEKLKAYSMSNKEILKTILLRDIAFSVLMLSFIGIGTLILNKYRSYITGEYYHYISNEYAFEYNKIFFMCSILVYLVMVGINLFKDRMDVESLC